MENAKKSGFEAIFGCHRGLKMGGFLAKLLWEIHAKWHFSFKTFFHPKDIIV